MVSRMPVNKVLFLRTITCTPSLFIVVTVVLVYQKTIWINFSGPAISPKRGSSSVERIPVNLLKINEKNSN